MAGTIPQSIEQHNAQRVRLLKRMAASDVNTVSDVELLEIMLAPMCSTAHSLTIRLLERFGTLHKVLYADDYELQSIEGVNEGVTHALRAMRAFALRMVKSQLIDQPVIQSWSALMDYLKLAAGYGKVEEFRVLFMNHRHALIADEVLHRGTVNHTPVYPREVVRRAIELSAAAVILVHNHPSGDPTPSPSDIKVTKDVVAAAATVGVSVHDHIIVSENSCYSFRSFGLLDAPQPKQQAIEPVGSNDGLQSSLF